MDLSEDGVRVAVAGGALQGVEVTYLARKAGFETLLLDRKREPPAAGLCHEFVCLDMEDHDALGRALESVDVVIPATENAGALRSLVTWCREAEMPLAFDEAAYAISSSKQASEALFHRLNLPTPASWPNCSFPVLAKPDGGSGSRGVRVFADSPSLEARFGALPPPGWVLQEYLEGPSFSIEVLGRPGAYLPLQVTDLEMDRAFDCKRVMAPASLPSNPMEHLRKMAVVLAEGVALSGIMDVEVILHDGGLKVLEIDARFPSQTPMAVYQASGVNMVELLLGLFLDEAGNGPVPAPAFEKDAAILEHVRVRPGHLSVCGEEVMAEVGRLHLEEGFFGAHEAVTDYAPGSSNWVATLMICGSDPEDARSRREGVIAEIRDRFGLGSYHDDDPGSWKRGRSDATRIP
jgi:pyrrolysine biosynthesis protein PylC